MAQFMQTSFNPMHLKKQQRTPFTGNIGGKVKVGVATCLKPLRSATPQPRYKALTGLSVLPFAKDVGRSQ